MALNLASIMPAQTESEIIDYAELEIDLLEFENELNNCCNALEIAEKAQESQSSEVLQFAESLLGVSCEELVKGLGYEKDHTKKDMAESALTKLSMAKKAFQQLYKDFGALKKKAKPVKVTLTLPNLGTTVGAFLSKLGFNKDFKKEVTIAEACSRYQTLCTKTIDAIDQAIDVGVDKATKQAQRMGHHKVWRQYQLLIAFGRRAVKVARETLEMLKKANG